MEMVAAARLRRAEQRIEALRPYAAAIRRMTRQAAEAAENVPSLPILAEHEEQSSASACCWSPATAASRARSTRRSCAPGCGRGASTRPRARVVWYASGRRPASSLAFRGLDVAGSLQGSPTGPPTPTRARSPNA